MKNNNLLPLVLSFFFLSTTLSAQSSWNIGSFKVKKLDFSQGYETDYINGLDYTFFTAQMPEAQQAVLSELNFRPQDFHSGICENPSLNFGITLEYEKLKNFEWRNAFAIKKDRVDAVTYYNNSRFDGDFLNIYSTHNEYTLESALVYKLPLGSFMNIYTGVGTNLGLTSNNQTCIFTSFDITASDISFSNVDEVPAGQFGSGDGYEDCYSTGTQLNQRVFGQIGFGFIIFKRLEIGMDIKYGYGYRADFGSSIDGTQIVANNINFRYILK